MKTIGFRDFSANITKGSTICGTSPTSRLISLDILRGITIFLMILGNCQPDSGVAYATLLHRPWEGINLIDLAFPSFVFMMGTAMVLSKSGFYEGWFYKLLRRTFLLFIFGYLVNHCGAIFSYVFNSNFGIANLYDALVTHARYMGVLHRLALAYFFGSLIYYFCRDNYKLLSAAFMLLFLSSLGYHAYNPAEPFHQLNNISTALDSIFPGAAHNYCGAPFDPEGLYGTVNSISSLLLGGVAGIYLKDITLLKRNIGILLVLGIFLLIMGLIWSSYDIISKPLWTTPYVLIVASLDVFLLALLTFLEKQIPAAKNIFVVFQTMGRNPLVIYLISEFSFVLFISIPFTEEISLLDALWYILRDSMTDSSLAALIFSLMWVFICMLIAIILRKKNIIIRV